MDEELLRVNPNPRLVWLMNYAIDEIVPSLGYRGEYNDWLSWASSWKSGQRSPANCVDAAHRCFEHKNDPIWHCLGQLAWGAKEACYDSQKSGWLVVRYIADAMIAFGIAFPKEGTFLAPPIIDLEGSTSPTTGQHALTRKARP